MNPQTLIEVLQPRARATQIELVKAWEPPSGPESELVAEAAAQVRAIYTRGTARIESGTPECFADACADTWLALSEVTDGGNFDVKISSIALAVIERAFVGVPLLKPTTLRAQVEMQMKTVEAARAIRRKFPHRFANQLPLGV